MGTSMPHHTLLGALEEWSTAAVSGGGILWTFSVVVRNLPTPEEVGGRYFLLYRWFYRTVQQIAANKDLIT